MKHAAKSTLCERALLLLEKAGPAGMTARSLKLKLNRRKDVVLKMLEEAKAEGKIFKKKKRFYASSMKKMKYGILVKLSKNFGFVRPLDAKEGEPDIFIAGDSLRGALPGARVMVKLQSLKKTERPLGEIVSVLTQGSREFIGIAVLKESGWRVWADKLDQKFPLIGAAPAVDRSRVLVRLDHHDDDPQQDTLQLIKDYGSADEAKNTIRAILDLAGISTDFSPAALEEARCLARRGISDEELAGRLDLRAWDIFTLDGADAKDLDDAISVRRTEEGWLLGVHIADVSHYVKPNSALDREAFARGTSVYYANEAVPMLPRELSHGICSLNPGEDRLCFSVMMELDAEGALIGRQFQKSVIRSRVKGVYSEINRLLAGETTEALLEKYAPVLAELPAIRELGTVLRSRQLARGSLDIHSVECRITTDEDGRAIDIRPRQSGEAERIIESFMLLANETAAKFAAEAHLSFVYRVHSRPAPAKLEKLQAVLKAMGEDTAPLQKEDPSPSDLNAILKQAEGRPIESAVHLQVLRSMNKATYSSFPTGHYGLALADYTHFTSPIRRYPDLVVHRILTACLEEGSRPYRFCAFAPRAAKQATLTEINAAAAERACEECYKAEYMRSRIGLVCDGVISGVTAHGLYVTVHGCIEGMIPAGVLPEGEYLVESGFEMVEAHTRRRYRLGESLQVTCTSADIPTGKILLALA